MDRKWTLDRIEFDNETYEITRPGQVAEAAPDHSLAALQLGLTPALSLTPRSSGRRQAFVPPTLTIADPDVGSTEPGRGEAGSMRRRFH